MKMTVGYMMEFGVVVVTFVILASTALILLFFGVWVVIKVIQWTGVL